MVVSKDVQARRSTSTTLNAVQRAALEHMAAGALASSPGLRGVPAHQATNVHICRVLTLRRLETTGLIEPAGSNLYRITALWREIAAGLPPAK